MPVQAQVLVQVYPSTFVLILLFFLYFLLYFLICVFLGGTVPDFQHALATVGASCTEEAQMFFPVAGEGTVPRQILVASRRCSPLNMSLPTASAQSSHDCSYPVVGGPVVEVDKVWDVASTPTLGVHLSSGSSGRGNSLPFLLSSKPGLTTLDSDIDVSDLLADLPEVLRAGMNNGSLVPAYGSTGESFFSSLTWESFSLSFLFSPLYYSVSLSLPRW